MALEQSKELEEIKVMIQNQKQLVKDQAQCIQNMQSDIEIRINWYNDLKQAYEHMQHDRCLTDWLTLAIVLMSGIITGVML